MLNKEKIAISNIPSIPNLLKEELLRDGNNVVVFFGNGISRLAGVISWEKMGIELLKFLLKDEKITCKNYRILRKKNTIEQISIFNEKMKFVCPDDYKKKIIYYIKDLLKPKEEQKFKNIYRYLSNLNASKYVTTNYLTGFDKNEIKTMTYSTEFNVENPTEYSKPKDDKKQKEKIYYLHGTLDVIKNVDDCYDNLVLTLPQYLQQYKKDSKINNFLNYIFSEKTVLFVGLGFQEYEIIQHLVPPPQNKQNRHYWLKPYVAGEETLQKEYEEMYKNLSINIVWYNIRKEEYIVLADILEKWSSIIEKEKNEINSELTRQKEILESIRI